MSRRRAAAFRFVLLGTTLALLAGVVVAAELALRYRERHRTTPPDYFPTMFYPHRRVLYGLVPNLDYFGWFRINSLGFRGREVAQAKPAGTIRIVCLGGSTTFDTGVVGRTPPWPETLERALGQRFPGTRIEVLNLGIPGAAILDSLVDLQIRALRLQPDIVIVFQGHNDFRYSTRPPGAPTGLYPDEQPPRSSMGRWLQTNSILYAKSYAPVESMTNRALIRLGLSPNPEEGFNQQRQQERITAALNTFRTHLRSIGAVAHANRVQLVAPAVIFPREKAGETCGLCAQMPVNYGGLPYDRILTAYDAYNAAIREEVESQGGHFVPTTDWIPSNRRHYSDTVHFTPEGSLLMGRRLGEAIAPIVATVLAPLQ